MRRNYGPHKTGPWIHLIHACLDRHLGQATSCFSPHIARKDGNFRGLCHHFSFLGTAVFVTNVAEGAIQYFTNSICVDVWGGGCLTGLCVGARKGFVTLTVLLCVERCLLFLFKTEAKGWEADRDLTVRISFRDLFPCSEKWMHEGKRPCTRKTKPFATAWECLLCLPLAHT